jgi:hypothetical protein
LELGSFEHKTGTLQPPSTRDVRLRTMSCSIRNPAQASIVLTYRNYTGPSLLQIVNGMPTSQISAAASPPARMSPATKRESSEDINAPPKSDSSDEEGSSPVEPAAAPQLEQISHDIGQDAPAGKRAAGKECERGLRSTGLREPRLKDEGPQLPSPS